MMLINEKLNEELKLICLIRLLIVLVILAHGGRSLVTQLSCDVVRIEAGEQTIQSIRFFDLIPS